MYHQLCYHTTLILVLLSIYCNASPIPSVEQNQQPAFLSNTINEQSNMMERSISNTNDEMPSNKVLNEFYHLRVLCALYGGCNDNNNQEYGGFDDTKHKRLSASLFHGIPKFGKRAFSAAFAGLPKFG